MDPYSPLFAVVRAQREHVKMALGVASEEGPDGIVAVVSNVEAGHEECCVLVLRRRRKDATQAKVVDGLAIGSDLQASMGQCSTGPMQWQFTLTSRGRTVRGTSDDAQGIKDLLAVAREAATTAAALDQPPSHAWVQHYVHGDKVGNMNADVPIFSRFTTSAIAPSRADSSRPRPPSPGEKEVKMSVGTFNVNGQAPSDIDLRPWLHIADDEPDVLVVGLQEAESSNLSYVVWTPYVEDGWSAAVEAAMGQRVDEYEKLASKQLVGILVLVYVRREILPRIGAVATSSVGVGFGGWAANKGATAVRFELDDIPLCIVVSHLSAFDTHEARERRRWDYREIIKRMHFTLFDSDQGGDGGNEDSAEVGQRDAETMLRAQLDKDASWTTEDESTVDASWASLRKSQTTVLDHDVVFWTGDLNFRLELGIGEVKRLIQKREYEGSLLRFDQLRSEIEAKTCFDGFEEMPIAFAPTYKFDRGTDQYDTSEKRRTPSWTDRVLWRQSRSIVQPVHYESCDSIRISDHKPVLATFLLRLDADESKKT